MNIHFCGPPPSPVEFPDTGQVCCYGVANDGPKGCTCWEPVYDLEQQPLTRKLVDVRTKPCEDCAYRGGSPERRGDDEYAGDGELLERLAQTGQPFFCHQGIRKPVRYRHPSGMEIPGHVASYDPPMLEGRPYKADGTPADFCAGWAARRLKILSEAPPLQPHQRALAEALMSGGRLRYHIGRRSEGWVLEPPRKKKARRA